MVHYDNCFDSYHNEPLSCMGAKASQPTHFLKVRLTGVRLSEIHYTCNPDKQSGLFLTHHFL